MLRTVCAAAAAVLLAGCGEAPSELDQTEPVAGKVAVSQPPPVTQTTVVAPPASGDGFSSDEEVDPNFEESEPDLGEPVEETASEATDPYAPQEDAGGW